MIKLLKRIRINLRNNYYAKKHFSKISLDKNNSNFIIFASPIHKNLGDHAIIDAELGYFSAEFPNINVIEVPRQFTDYFMKKFDLNEKDLIFIHGGGFFGNLYPIEMENVNKVISRYQTNEIIIFPQTLFFDNSVEIDDEFYSEFKKHSKVSIFLREQKSFDLAYESKSFKDIFLVPDIVLYNEPEVGNTESIIEKILVVLRKDAESTLKFDSQKLTKTLVENNYLVEETDTVANNSKFILPVNRSMNVQAKLNQFRNSDLIITDRLHGMIFAYIAGKRCIALDNQTGKSSGVFDLWLKNTSYISIVKGTPNLNEFVDLVKKYESPDLNNLEDMRSNFKQLTDHIKSKIETKS